MSSIKNNFAYVEPDRELFNARMKNSLHLCNAMKPMRSKKDKISKIMGENQSLIYRGDLKGSRITVQKSNDKFSFLNMKMEVIHRESNELEHEIKAFSSLLPDNTGLDGMVTSNNSSSIYVIMDIITPRNITLSKRLDTLSRMYNDYILDFGKPEFFSIVEYITITNNEDLTEHLSHSKCKFFTLGNHDSLYIYLGIIRIL